MKGLSHNIIFFSGLLWLALCGSRVWGQDTTEVVPEVDLSFLEIEGRMLDFYHQLSDLEMQLPRSNEPESLTEVERQVSMIDTKWNAYYQSRQSEIAADDSLLQIVVNYQLVKQELQDSITSKRHLHEVQEQFTASEKFLLSQDSVYHDFYERAFEYSLVKALSSELDKIKGKEQLLFSEIEGQYEQAKSLSREVPSLDARFQKMEEKYLELKNSSEKIQSLKYEPFLQRIKDYLYSIAAIAMILMFVNVVQAKLKSLKQARENAKKLRQMMNNEEENDYPTI